MPCESCNVQFTVFKRKRLCSECRRFYCSHCLVKRKERILCERCVILTARPLSKSDLLKLKPKDLIFYLQSKHISTTGCVEKEELVNLVITHVNSSTVDYNDSQSSNPSSPRRSTADGAASGDFENCSNPFDQIKQTCQSLFSSFAEKIVDLNFENKPTNNTASNQTQNIFNQPRFQTREMPTYASHTQANNIQTQYSNDLTSMPRSSSSTSDLINVNRPPVHSQSASSTSPSSPIISIGSVSSHFSSTQLPHPLDEILPTAQEGHNNSIPSIHRGKIKSLIDNLQDVNASGCECSDDEVLTEFSNRHNSSSMNVSSNLYVEKLSPQSQSDSAFEDQIPGPSGSGAQSASPSKLSSGEHQKSSEESSGSSFEELGAVGGANDWQIVDKTDVSQPLQRVPASSSECRDVQPQPSTSSATITFPTHSTPSAYIDNVQSTNNKPRRLNRRRSDTCVVRTTSNRLHRESFFDRQIEDDESDDINREISSCKRVRKCCHKCGKTKNSLKSKLIKFRRQLETMQLSEVDMKREIEDFLTYLERKSKESFDLSDSDTNIPDNDEQNISTLANLHTIRVEDADIRNDDDGIHVYGSRVEESYSGPWKHDSRFLNLADFKSSSELEELSVKQLKEILMLNRVDFKGCCEKQELFERVYRLWNDLQTSPAVDKLPTDDLCKICMDAPIECVILECGHMATCTNCGKVLSECPICRQYIVRVVRFFRA